MATVFAALVSPSLFGAEAWAGSHVEIQRTVFIGWQNVKTEFGIPCFSHCRIRHAPLNVKTVFILQHVLICNRLVLNASTITGDSVRDSSLYRNGTAGEFSGPPFGWSE